MKNRGLGKGLSALIGERSGGVEVLEQDSILKIGIDELEISQYQPRKIFDEEAIEELAESIARHGIIQPLIVRKIPHHNKYEIIAGERRWRAAKMCGLDNVPAILKNLDEVSIAEQSLIENVQRENLNPLEEAEGYLELMNKFNYTQEELAKAVGKKRSHVANMVRITNLTDLVKSQILSGALSFSHAKLIVSCDNAEEIANEIIKKNLSVRETEDLIKNWQRKKRQKTKTDNLQQVDQDELSAITRSIKDKLGIKVIIDAKGSKGKITLYYDNYNQLDTIIEKLNS